MGEGWGSRGDLGGYLRAGSLVAAGRSLANLDAVRAGSLVPNALFAGHHRCERLLASCPIVVGDTDMQLSMAGRTDRNEGVQVFASHDSRSVIAMVYLGRLREAAHALV